MIGFRSASTGRRANKPRNGTSTNTTQMKMVKEWESVSRCSGGEDVVMLQYGPSNSGKQPAELHMNGSSRSH